MTDLTHTLTVIALALTAITLAFLWYKEGVKGAELGTKIQKLKAENERKTKTIGYYTDKLKESESKRNEHKLIVDDLKTERDELKEALEAQKGINTPEDMVKALKTAFEEL